MKKRWFDDWKVEKLCNGGLRVELPHSKSGVNKVAFRSIKNDARINWLAMVIDCALTELTKKK